MAKERLYLGKIKKVEAEGIELAIERLAGLEELLLIVTDETMACDINAEIVILREKCMKWWGKITNQYGWTEYLHKDWEINFMENKIWIV